MGKRRRRLERTDDWHELELLCAWEEQKEYERIRPLVLFRGLVPERAAETGISERTLYRRIAGFEEDGLHSLFGSEPAKRRVLPPSVRRLIVDLKAEHPALNLNEIAGICFVRTRRRPHVATVRAVIDEEPLAIKAFKRFPPYHEMPEGAERRKAVVALHYEGWANKSIARYLKVDRSTVRRVLARWMEEGPAGLEDKKRGRPKGVQKVDLEAMVEVRRLQENPELGAYRVRTALERIGIFLSTRTVGRMLRANREAEGLAKPKRRAPTPNGRCPSRPRSAMRPGPRTCATWTTLSPGRGRPTSSPSWTTTRGQSSPARSRSPRTRTPTSPPSTPP